MNSAIYTCIPKDHNASNYYRQSLPLDICRRLNLPIDQIIDRFNADLSMHDRFSYVVNVDILLLYHVISHGYIDFLKQLNSVPALKSRITGQLRYPPMLIVDTDDDVFNVDPTNLSFEYMDYKVNGEELEKGAVVTMRDVNGKDLVIWEDGKNGFDIEANKARVALWRDAIKISKLCTVTTERCAQYVLNEVPDANVFVSPNAIDFEAYPKIDLREHDEVRILWQGGDSHFQDLIQVQKSLRAVAEKYPNVKWMLFGQRFKWFEEAIGKNVEYIPWVPYPAYKFRLSTLGHDINLCPLRNAPFNLAKSAIKFYESSAICRPAATIAARVGPYEDSIIDGETGLLYDSGEDLEVKLGGLIEDAQLRKTLSTNAVDWIHTHRDAEKIIPKLYNKWMETLAGYYVSHPKDLNTAPVEQLVEGANLVDGAVTYKQ